MKKILYILIGATVLFAGYYLYMYWALGNDSVAQDPTPNQNDTSIGSGYPEGLEAEVYKTVDSKTNGEWDMKLAVTKIDESEKTAEGTWYANDAWGWIAWQETEGKWKTLVSLDGFDCEELKSIPSEYSDFFFESTHIDGKLYCYSHQ